MSESTIRVGAGPDTLRTNDADVDVFGAPTSEEVAKQNPLEQLRAALSAAPVKELLTLRVPSRPGVTLRFNPDVDDDKRKAWTKRATKKSRRPGVADEVDDMLFACLVIANTNVAVAFDGVDAHDEEDTPLSFRHRQLWDMVNAREPQQAIRNLFANDPHVLVASGEILMAAGFDDDLEESDPTRAS